MVALTGCATSYSPKICEQLDPEFYTDTRDSLEPMNRSFFKFNMALDDAVLEPVAKAYRSGVPKFVQRGISNFSNFSNEPRNFTSTLMQGKLGESARVVLRLAINSTFGLAGTVDAASKLGLPYKDHDYGHAFAYWGFGDGEYTVFPFLGSTNTRDTLGTLLHWKYTYSVKYIKNSDLKTTVQLAQIVNSRAQQLPFTDLLDEQPDQYVFVRESYRQNRIKQICEQ